MSPIPAGKISLHSLSVVDVAVGHVLDPLAGHSAFAPVALIAIAAIPCVTPVAMSLVLVIFALVTVTAGEHLHHET